MFFRIVTGIASHFESRLPEWVMAGTIAWWGLKLVGEENAWSNPQAWSNMLTLMPENAWGWLCVGLGLTRLLALAINGTFSDTAYSRFSPHIRGLCAIAGAWLWLMVFISVSAVSTSGSGIYQLPLALDVWCIFHAWRDVGRAKAARDGTV
jgi:hypothetical protein